MAGTNQSSQPAPELSEGTLGPLFEKSPDAIFLIDGDTLVDCNPAAVEMLRYPGKSELLTVSPVDLSPPSQPDGRPSSVMSEMIASAILRGSHRFEWTVKRSDGSELPVEVL